jgi:hypothetical protein
MVMAAEPFSLSAIMGGVVNIFVSPLADHTRAGAEGELTMIE